MTNKQCRLKLRQCFRFAEWYSSSDYSVISVTHLLCLGWPLDFFFCNTNIVEMISDINIFLCASVSFGYFFKSGIIGLERMRT